MVRDVIFTRSGSESVLPLVPRLGPAGTGSRQANPSRMTRWGDGGGAPPAGVPATQTFSGAMRRMVRPAPARLAGWRITIANQGLEARNILLLANRVLCECCESAVRAQPHTVRGVTSCVPRAGAQQSFQCACACVARQGPRARERTTRRATPEAPRGRERGLSGKKRG